MRWQPLPWLLLSAACAAASPPPPTDPARHELHLDQAVELGGGLVVEWTALEDSRCPEGVQCVWAGEATVTLALRPADGEPREVKLTDGAKRNDERQRVAVDGRELRLVAVLPYPKDGVRVDREDLVAVVRLVDAAADDAAP